MPALRQGLEVTRVVLAAVSNVLVEELLAGRLGLVFATLTANPRCPKRMPGWPTGRSPAPKPFGSISSLPPYRAWPQSSSSAGRGLPVPKASVTERPSWSGRVAARGSTGLRSASAHEKPPMLEPCDWIGSTSWSRSACFFFPSRSTLQQRNSSFWPSTTTATSPGMPWFKRASVPTRFAAHSPNSIAATGTPSPGSRTRSMCSSSVRPQERITRSVWASMRWPPAFCSSSCAGWLHR